MAIPVQTAKVQNSNGTSATSSTAWASNLTVGNIVIVCIALSGSTNNPSPTVSSVSLGTDALSLVTGATVTNGSGSTGVHVEMWSGTVATASQKTLTINVSTAASIEAATAEYAGATYTTTLDGSVVTNTSNNANPINTGSITTTNANDLLVAAIGENGSSTYSTPRNSFVIEVQEAGGGGGTGNNATGGGASGLLDRVVTATGTYSTGATPSVTGAAATIIAAFQQAAIIPPPPSPAPPVSRIYLNFAPPVVKPQGYIQAFTSSVPLAFYYGPPPPIANILRNFSPLPRQPQGYVQGWNFSVPFAFPTPPAPNIRQIFANFAVFAHPPGFIQGWNSSVPLAFPTPPAPNIAAILRNFGPLPRQPQGYIQAWDLSVPLAFPTPPAPNVRQIYLNFAPAPLQPQGYIVGWTSVIPAFPTPPAPPIPQIYLNFLGRAVQPQGFVQAWSSEIVAAPSLIAIPPIRQIIQAWQPRPLVIPSGFAEVPLIVVVSSMLAVPPLRQILAAWEPRIAPPPFGISWGPPPLFPMQWIPLYLTTPDIHPKAVLIFQERIESVRPSLMVQIFASGATIPRNSAVTVTAKVTLPDGGPLAGMLPVLYIYAPNGSLVQKQTMRPTGDPTLFELPYFIPSTAPTGPWGVEVVSALGNLALDSGIIEGGFTVT